MFFFFYWHFALLKGQKDKKDKNLVMPHTAQAHRPWAASPVSVQKPDTAPTWARHGQKKKAAPDLGAAGDGCAITD